MPKFYFEDFSPGWTAEYGPRRVTREEMIGFAAQYDPQPMHLDEEAARKTMLGGLGASGWHTCAILMKMIADNLLLDAASMGAPGIDEVKWLAPLRPGVTLSVRRTTLEVRPSKSRPELGFVKFLFELIADETTVVTTQLCSIMFGRRQAA